MTGVGQMLTDAREARRISIEQAERDTRIGRRYLLALEAEDFAAFPARVYSRGFLRSYASYLGLNPADLIALMPDEAPAGGDLSRRTRGPAKPPPPAPRTPRVPELLTEGGRDGKAALGPKDPRRADLVPPPLRAALRRAGERLKGAAANRPEALNNLPFLRLAAAVFGVLVLALVLGRCVEWGDGASGVQTAPGDAPAPTFAPLPSVDRRMPDLRGMEESAARARLRELGVDAVVIELPSREAPAGQVVRQSPAPNQTIGRTIVTVVISRGG